MGVPVRQRDRRPIRERLQTDVAAAKLVGAVGVLAEERRPECSQALRGQGQFFQSGEAVSFEMELLQVTFLSFTKPSMCWLIRIF